MVRARAQDPKTGLLLNPAVTLRVTSGQAVLPSGSWVLQPWWLLWML